MWGQPRWIPVLGVMLFACSGEPAEPGGSGAGGSASGAAGAGGASTTTGGSGVGGSSAGGSSAGGSSAGESSAGGSSTNAGATNSGGSNATAGGNVTGGSNGAGSSNGGAASGSGGLGGSNGAGTSGNGGSGGANGDEPICIIESLHLKVSGGMNFERNTNAEDICSVSLRAKSEDSYVTFFVMPPEVENTILIPVIADGVEPGKTGAFTPKALSVLVTGAIWSVDLPDAENPMKCSLQLTKNEKATGELWRVVGTVTCPSALSGIGPVGSTPLTLHDFSFSVLTDDVGPAAP